MIEMGYNDFADCAPFVAGDLIIAKDEEIYDTKTGETVRDVLGGRIAVCSMTPIGQPIIKDGKHVGFEWKWEHPLDFVPVHFYRKAKREEIEAELELLESDLKQLENRKEFFRKHLENGD